MTAVIVLAPVVQGRVMSTSRVVTLLAVLSGRALGGIVGAITAIPIVAIATVVVDDVVLPWRRRLIGSDGPEASDDDTGGSAP